MKMLKLLGVIGLGLTMAFAEPPKKDAKKADAKVEVKKAAEELGVEIELEKVTDFKQIMGFGVMSTPALVVDGRLKFSGKVLKAEALKEYLQ